VGDQSVQVTLWRVIVARGSTWRMMSLVGLAVVLLAVMAWCGSRGVQAQSEVATLALFVGLAVMKTWPLDTDPASSDAPRQSDDAE